MMYALASRIAASGAVTRLRNSSPIAAATNGTEWATIVSVHSRLRATSERSSTRLRHGTEETSGRALVATGSRACVLTPPSVPTALRRRDRPRARRLERPGRRPAEVEDHPPAADLVVAAPARAAGRR